MKNLGSKIDSLFLLREQKRGFEDLAKSMQAKITELEDALIEQMDEEGVTKSTGTKASVSITTAIKPNVESWDTFYQYIHKNKRYDLLERRPSVLACRELFETKGKIPGCMPVTLRKLNLRTL